MCAMFRAPEEYAELCRRIEDGWNGAIGSNASKEKQLTSVFVQGIIAAGLEQGVMLPQVGHDQEWLKEQFGQFKKRADGGEEDMKELVEDIEMRKLI